MIRIAGVLGRAVPGVQVDEPVVHAGDSPAAVSGRHPGPEPGAHAHVVFTKAFPVRDDRQEGVLRVEGAEQVVVAVQVRAQAPAVGEPPIRQQGATEALAAELDGRVVDVVVVLRDRDHVMRRFGLLPVEPPQLARDLQPAQQLLVGEVELDAEAEEVERLVAGVLPWIAEVEIELEEAVDVLRVRLVALRAGPVPDHPNAQLGEVVQLRGDRIVRVGRVGRDPARAARDQTVEPAHRVHQEAPDLPQGAGEARVRVVEKGGARPVEDLPDGDATQAGADPVVDRHRVHLAAALPKEASHHRERDGLPVVQAVRAGGVVVEASVVGMGEHVVGEVVVVEVEAVGEVGPEGARRDVREAALPDVLVVEPHEGVDARQLPDRHPDIPLGPPGVVARCVLGGRAGGNCAEAQQCGAEADEQPSTRGQGNRSVQGSSDFGGPRISA